MDWYPVFDHYLVLNPNYFTSKFPTLKELVFTREKRFGAKRILY